MGQIILATASGQAAPITVNFQDAALDKVGERGC